MLRIGQVGCAVGLYTAVTTSERIAFQILNRKTGNPVRRIYVDSETGKPVERDDQAREYALESGDFVMLDPDEIASAVPEGDKTMEISSFIACGDIDSIYFDKSYYLAPDGTGAVEAFDLLREGMRRRHPH